MPKTNTPTHTKAAYQHRSGETRSATAERHANMRAVTYEVKIQVNHLSRAKSKALKTLFREAKYLQNYAIHQHSLGVPFNRIDTKITEVPVKIEETPTGEAIFETRSIADIGSGIKQGITDRLSYNERAIIEKRSKGESAGDQRYRSELTSLYLKQYGNTYSFDEKHKYVYIQKIGWLKINGGRQFLDLHAAYGGIENVEIASAVLTRVASDYYVKVTCFVPYREEELSYALNRRMSLEDASQVGVYKRRDGRECCDVLTGSSCAGGLRVIGLDLSVGGCVASTGVEYSWCFPETGRLKAAQRRNQAYREYSKSRLGRARSSKRQREVIAVEYRRLRNRKDDAARKFIAGLMREFDVVVFQDDPLPVWRRGLSEESRSVLQHSIAGRLKALLLSNPRVVVLDRGVPTTRVCSDCFGVVSDGVPVGVRGWVCSSCGCVHDRDLNAADVMIVLASRVLGVFDSRVCDGVLRLPATMCESFARVSRGEALGVLVGLRGVLGFTGVERIGYQAVIA